MAVKVKIQRDQITLFDEKGEELVAWSDDEWREDPDLVLIIALAIHQLHARGGDYIRQSLKP